MDTNCQKLAVKAMLLLGLGWSLNSCITKALRADLSPLQQLSLQSAVAIAAIFLGAILGWHDQLSKLLRLPSRSEFVLLHLRAVLGGVLGIGLIISSYHEAPISHIVWIQALPFPVFWAFIVNKEQLCRRQVGLLAVSFLGVAVIGLSASGITGSIDGSEMAAASRGWGETKAVLGYSLFSLGLVLGRPLAEKLGLTRAMTWSFLLMACYSALASIVLDGWPTFLLRADSGLPIGTLAVLVITLGIIGRINSSLVFFGYQHLPASRATLLEKLQSVWAPCLALAFFAEAPSALSLFGATLIVLGAVGAVLNPCLPVTVYKQ